MGSKGDVEGISAGRRTGTPEASAELLSRLYRELHELAGAAMRRERGDHTLQPTALVHEAYLRLVRDDRETWRDQAHFFAAAASAMRRVLVDHARRRDAEKRGGGRRRVTIHGVELEAPEEDALDLIALDEALTELARTDERKSRLVELRFFVGLGFKEAAEVLGVSEVTAKRDWGFAKAWLYRRMSAKKDRIR